MFNNLNGSFSYNPPTTTAPSTPAASATSSGTSAQGTSSATSVAARISSLRIELPIGSEVRNGRLVYTTEGTLSRQFESLNTR